MGGSRGSWRGCVRTWMCRVVPGFKTSSQYVPIVIYRIHILDLVSLFQESVDTMNIRYPEASI